MSEPQDTIISEPDNLQRIDVTKPAALAAPVEQCLNELTAEIARLSDLFSRRLMEDKTKKAQFDELYKQLLFAREGLVKQTLTPIVSELILILDRIEATPALDEMVQSIHAELVEVLARRGITPIAVGDYMFNPSIHEAVALEESADVPAGRIVSVERTGYRSGDNLLRPVQVTIAKAIAAPTD